MKMWISAIILSALLATGGMADACHKGAKSDASTANKSVHGKITGVGSTSFTMTVGRRNHSRSMVVNLGPGTSITGITAFNSSIVGDIATVQGVTSGDAINAASIKIDAASTNNIRTGHHKR